MSGIPPNRPLPAILIYILFLTFLLYPLPSPAEALDGEAFFKAGLQFYKKGSYENAVAALTKALKKLPVIGDYSLLYISKAYIETGNTDESLKNIRKLLTKYPDSPLKKEAMGIEILNALTTGDEDKAIQLLESYVNGFPSDEETKFLFGWLLKKRQDDRAKLLFKQVYIDAGPLSMEAYEELKPPEVSSGDLLERASNLIKTRRYKEAEHCLRAALTGDNIALREDILEKLGLTLFRQKRYPEAAKVYLEIDDLYSAARSFFRAEKLPAFKRTLKRLILSKDEKAAELLIAHAVEKQKQGDTSGALSLLSETVTKFPSMSEKALWSTGWINYLNRDFKKALKVFTELYSTYKSSKYLYWKARVIEKTGGDASHIYRKLGEGTNGPSTGHGRGMDFYGFLARIKTNKISPAGTEQKNSHKPGPIERVDILLEAGMQEEAASELLYMAGKTSRYHNLLDIACRLKEISRYREAILLMMELPDEMRSDEVLYPLAYWSTVNEISSMHRIDPLLLLSVMREESRFDPEAYSPAGAIGLMQLMPKTADRIARIANLKINNTGHIYDIKTNIKLGTHYLSSLMKELDSVSAALAAYNAGEHRVKEWLKHGRYEHFDEFIEDIPYEETRKYVKRILTTYSQYRRTRYPQYSSNAGTVIF